MNDVLGSRRGRPAAASAETEPADADGWLSRIAALAPVIAAAASVDDRDRRLSPELMAALHAEGLFRLLLPSPVGGAEVSLPTFFHVIEALAAHDGSTAWCVCQGNGCAMMGAFLDAAVAQAIWGRDPQAIVSWGPGKAQAAVVEGGYRVTASCAFVSGVRRATWLGAHCAVVERDGAPRLMPDGTQEIRTAFFPVGAASLKDNWDVIGLRGTGSDAFSVDGLFVPEDHTMVRGVDAFRRCYTPLYAVPQMAIYAIGFAATALGIARGFLDAFVALAQEKRPRLVTSPLRDNPVVQDEVARAEARLSAARAFLLAETGGMWREVVAADAVTVAQRMRVRLASTHAIHEAKAAVDVLYDTAGTSAVFAASPFERRFRDIHTVALQIQGRKTHFQTVGAWLLGHPPDGSVI